MHWLLIRTGPPPGSIKTFISSTNLNMKSLNLHKYQNTNDLGNFLADISRAQICSGDNFKMPTLLLAF